jgi:hypothetical protein
MSSVASIQSGTPAAESPLRQGTRVLGPGDNISAIVADVDITANSTIVVNSTGVVDATARTFTAFLDAGVGFYIVANANATLNTNIKYSILSYS